MSDDVDETTIPPPSGDPVVLVIRIDVEGSGAAEARGRLEDAERLVELADGIEELFERLSGFVPVLGSKVTVHARP